jgi:hypothetical protein
MGEGPLKENSPILSFHQIIELLAPTGDLPVSPCQEGLKLGVLPLGLHGQRLVNLIVEPLLLWQLSQLHQLWKLAASK